MKIDDIRRKRGAELKAFREEHGISQLKLSKLSTLTPKTICKIEKGAISWNVDSEILYFEAIVSYVRSKQG